MSDEVIKFYTRTNRNRRRTLVQFYRKTAHGTVRCCRFYADGVESHVWVECPEYLEEIVDHVSKSKSQWRREVLSKLMEEC